MSLEYQLSRHNINIRIILMVSVSVFSITEYSLRCSFFLYEIQQTTYEWLLCLAQSSNHTVNPQQLKIIPVQTTYLYIIRSYIFMCLSVCIYIRQCLIFLIKYKISFGSCGQSKLFLCRKHIYLCLHMYSHSFSYAPKNKNIFVEKISNLIGITIRSGC